MVTTELDGNTDSTYEVSTVKSGEVTISVESNVFLSFCTGFDTKPYWTLVQKARKKIQQLCIKIMEINCNHLGILKTSGHN